MRVTSLLPIFGVIAALGCSGESVPAAANLSGTWNFNYVTGSAAGIICHSTMTFTIVQTDQTFVGSQSAPGTLTCPSLTLNLPVQNAANPAEFDDETIPSGIVSPNTVAFTLNTLRGQQSGTVMADTAMSGTTTWTVPVKPGGNITLTGTWTATRQ